MNKVDRWLARYARIHNLMLFLGPNGPKVVFWGQKQWISLGVNFWGEKRKGKMSSYALKEIFSKSNEHIYIDIDIYRYIDISRSEILRGRGGAGRKCQCQCSWHPLGGSIAGASKWLREAESLGLVEGFYQQDCKLWSYRNYHPYTKWLTDRREV